MKVFISWSGDTSHSLAIELRNWLPDVLQSVEPWVSSEDIAKGVFWNPKIVEALQAAQFGLCCLTPDNIDSPWMAFEAGAMIQRQQNKERVSPILLGLKPTDKIGLYGSLQHTQLTLEDITKLVNSINQVSEKPIAEPRARSAVERLWPTLEVAANRILTQVKPADAARSKRDPEAILEDVLEQLRSQGGQLAAQSTQLSMLNMVLTSSAGLAIAPVHTYFNPNPGQVTFAGPQGITPPSGSSIMLGSSPLAAAGLMSPASPATAAVAPGSAAPSPTGGKK